MHAHFLEEFGDFLGRESAVLVVDLVFLGHLPGELLFLHHVEKQRPREAVHDDFGVVYLQGFLLEHGAAEEVGGRRRVFLADNRELRPEFGVLHVLEQKHRTGLARLVVVVFLLLLLVLLVVVVALPLVVVARVGQPVSVVLRRKGVPPARQIELLDFAEIAFPVVVGFEPPAKPALLAAFLQPPRHLAAGRPLANLKGAYVVRGQILFAFGAVLRHGFLFDGVDVLAQHQRAVQHVHFLEPKVDAQVAAQGKQQQR